MEATGVGRDAPSYQQADGSLDMRTLLGEFQGFWREHSESWTGRFDYREAAPHLVLMAYLQRVLNGGGRLVREMAAGSGRLDLCLEFGDRRYPIELKVRRNEKTVADGLLQLSRYLDTLGDREGWLVVFDRRAETPWDAKITWATEAVGGRTIHVVGC
jgi:hypothetical protein